MPNKYTGGEASDQLHLVLRVNPVQMFREIYVSVLGNAGRSLQLVGHWMREFTIENHPPVKNGIPLQEDERNATLDVRYGKVRNANAS